MLAFYLTVLATAFTTCVWTIRENGWVLLDEPSEPAQSRWPTATFML